ncbi:MAG: hypothetical protein AABY88_11310 [Pseudomonadota bacterium]
MNKTLKRIAMATSVSVVALGATPAFATGTTAGSTITNTATVNYQVGGVSQTAINASNNITVDRKVDLVVAEVGNATTSVAPGATAQVTTFTVRNTSNAPLDLGLAVTQQTGGTTAHGGTDTFDVTAPSLFVDTNGNGSYDAGTDTAVTFLDEVAADTQRTVFVVANIPITQVNGDVAGVRLTAQAFEAGTAATQGTLITQTAGANTAGVDTVFADAAGVTDTASDGRHSDDDDYTVSAPVLTVTKQSRVISDPINGTTNPKFIPGALVEYCIVVSNAATASSAANSVAISDPLPAQTTYETSYGIFVSGTYTGTPGSGTCNLDGTAGGSFAAGTVSGTLGSVAANTTRTLYFQVRIN